MFKFVENVTEFIKENLEKNAKRIESEIETYEKTAKEYEEIADNKEQEANKKEQNAALIDLNPQKEVQDYKIDDNGEEIPDGSHYETDEYEKSQNIARYNQLMKDAQKDRKDAAKYRKDIAKLRKLISMLKLLKGDIKGSIDNWNLAIENARGSINQTTKLLNDGITVLRSTILTSNLPNIVNIGKWIYQEGKKTASKIVENFSSNLEKVFGIDKYYGKTIEKLYSGLAVLGIFGQDIQIEYIQKDILKCYEEYLDTLDISEEEKTVLLKKLERNLPNIKILPKDEYYKYFDHNSVASYNEIDNTAYVCKGLRVSEMKIAHEIAGHSMGSMVPDEYKLVKNRDGFLVSKYTPYDMNTGKWYSGFDEATTQYFTRRIEKNPKTIKTEQKTFYFNELGCSYVWSVDALEKVTTSMTNTGRCNGEKILFQTYVGDDKTLFEKEFNKIMQDDGSKYVEFSELLAKSISSGPEANEARLKLEIFTKEFDEKCANHVDNKS